MPVPSANNRKPVVIIGFMGTGKSTVGRLLAAKLERPFQDLDDLIVESAGRPIAEIFRTEGEPAFRRLERGALVRALESDQAPVLATGGGAACREENLSLMLDRAVVVALSATPEEVLRRTGNASGRPLLDGADDPLAIAKQLLASREPFYERAHVRIDTVGKRPEEVAASALAALGKQEETR